MCIFGSFALSVHTVGAGRVVGAVGKGTSGSGTGSVTLLSQSMLGVDGDSGLCLLSCVGLSLGFVECFLFFLYLRCGECALEDALDLLGFLCLLLHSFFECFFRLRFFRGCLLSCLDKWFRRSFILPRWNF